MNIRASRVDTVALDEERAILSGSTITVFGILVANATGDTAIVDVNDAVGTNKVKIVCPANDTKLIDVEWVADGGVVFPTIVNSSVTVTIFHSGAGS